MCGWFKFVNVLTYDALQGFRLRLRLDLSDRLPDGYTEKRSHF